MTRLLEPATDIVVFAVVWLLAYFTIYPQVFRYYQTVQWQMAKRNRAEAGLTNGGGSRPKRQKGQEMSPEVEISSDHAYSDGEDDGDKRGKEEVKQQGLRMWQTVKDATSKE